MLRIRGFLPLVVMVSACGTSTLIHVRDPTFERSIGRFERSERAAEAAGAAPDETAMFLLGEGFYRYRFSFPRRSVSSYLAQVAAAAMDFPALQSFAGSLDMFHLRLRSYDGAVQVWETLLQQHPHTRLEPLTLYRLGWAYRNAVAPGFPRSSGEAFDALVRGFPDSPLVPLAHEAEAVPWKAQGSATAWSVIPGLGQIYAGEYLNGTIRVTISVAGAAMVLVPVVIAYERRADLSWSRDWPLLATGLGGLVVLSIDYSDSYEDALRAVIQYNERQEEAFEAKHPEAP